MKKLPLFFLLFSMISFGQNIKKHQWKKRVLLVFTTDIHSDDFKNQVLILQEHQKELLERKLVVYTFTKSEYAFNFENSWQKSKKFKNEEENFKALLVGLDGGIKLKQDTILSVKKLCTIIDGMPMRKNELEKQKK